MRNVHCSTLYSITAALLLAAAVGCGKQNPPTTDSDQTSEETGRIEAPSLQPSTSDPTVDRTLAARIDAERLRRAIDAAARYIIRSCDEEGKFTYLANLDPEAEVESDYNMIRHAGAIYALGAYNRWHPDESARRTMRRAGDFLKRLTYAPVPGDVDMAAIWTLRAVEGEESVPMIRLGGPGLGLIALAGLHQADPEAVSIEDLRRLGRFLLFMQKDDGTFYATYDPMDDGRSDKWYCLYYPGEVMLGLVMLAELDRDPAWLHAVSKGLVALEATRRGDSHPPPDHWAMLATAKLFEATKDNAARYPRELWRRHAAGVCRGILADRASSTTARPGDLSGDGHTCRIATRLEGIAAARSFLQDEQLNEKISIAAAEAVNLLLDAQIQGGPFDGAFTQIAFPDEADPESKDYQRATEIRIDYVQHALNALVLCAELAGLNSSAETNKHGPQAAPLNGSPDLPAADRS